MVVASVQDPALAAMAHARDDLGQVYAAAAAEHVLEQARAKAEQANRAKSRFLAAPPVARGVARCRRASALWGCP